MIKVFFTAKKRSDKYLEESRKSQRKEKKAEKSKKSKKKSKKNKPELHSDSDSDEPKAMHVVNTTIEIPEGAVMSDTDDKNDLDVNDPHRALDIDLEADDDFYAPQKSTKATKKSVDPEPVKSTRQNKKEVEPVLLMESEGTRKKEKKKHKRKKESPEVNLIETSEVASVEKKEKKSKKKAKDDEKPKKHKKSSSKKSEYEEAFGEVM